MKKGELSGQWDVEFKIWQQSEDEAPSVFTQTSPLKFKVIREYLTFIPARDSRTRAPAPAGLAAVPPAPATSLRATSSRSTAANDAPRPRSVPPSLRAAAVIAEDSGTEDDEVDGREDGHTAQDDSFGAEDDGPEDAPDDDDDVWVEGLGTARNAPDYEPPKQVEEWSETYRDCSPADIMIRYGLNTFVTMIVIFTNLNLDQSSSSIPRVSEHERYVYA